MSRSPEQRELNTQQALEGKTGAVLGTMVIILKGVNEGIELWQHVAPYLKPIIKAALDNVVGKFETEMANKPAAEQVIGSGELIKVLGVMEKILGKFAPPVINHYLSETIFIEELETAVLNAVYGGKNYAL
jgi:hypothetical protein